MARRSWTIVTLIVVLFIPLIVNTPYLPNSINAASNNSSLKSSPPPPYGGGTPIGQYWGSGGSTQVRAQYNKTMSTKSETTDVNDFQFRVPSNWQSSVNITLEDITADSPVVLDIETNDTAIDGNIFFSSSPHMSFQVTNSCYLHSLQIYINLIQNDALFDARVWIYNATDSAGTPRPDTAITGTINVELGAMGVAWKNHTFASPVFLNTSETYANTFFVRFLNDGIGISTWYMRSDVLSPPDNGYIWYSSPLQQWVGNDLMMNVSLLPLGIYPTPQQIGLQINGSSVNDTGSNSGWWLSTFIEPGSTAFFNVTASWPITFNYTYFADFNQTFTGSTAFRADYLAIFADWNISTVISFPNVGADINSRSLNFSLPAYWNMQFLYNGSTSILGFQVQDSSPSPGWVFLDEPNGAGNGTLWRVLSTDANRVQTPTIWHEGIDVTGSEVNITDLIHVEAQLSTFTDGEGRFVPYDTAGTDLFEERLSPDLSGLLNFTEFDPSASTTINDTLRCEVVWNNSYYVGIGLSTINLVFPTVVLGNPTSYSGLIGDFVNVSVYYEDTYNSVGIPNAVVNVTFGGTTYDLPNGAGGYYWGWVDTSSMSRMDHSGVVIADREGYSPTTTFVTLTLWSKTNLVANWTTLTISYTQSVVLETNYSVLTPLGEGGIAGAQVNVTDSASYFRDLSDVGDGNYTILLNGTDLGVGIHNLIVNASMPAGFYQNNTLYVTLTVTGEATNITGSSPASMFGGAPFNASIIYRKVSDGSGITNATITCLLNGSPFSGIKVVDMLNGTYHVQFILNVSGSGSTFTINLTASIEGFEPSTFNTSVFVDVRLTMIDVQVLSSTPVVHNGPFEILVTYQDLLSTQGVLYAIVQGNWSDINDVDNGDGTYSVTCVTTGASAGWWTISFNISVENYETQYFSETFYLVWATSLTPENGDYSPSEFENETLVLDVLFWDTSNSLAINGATVWAIFQSSPYSMVSIGSGVYRLSLNLTQVIPAIYSLTIYAQQPLYENQTLILSLEVLAKFDTMLTVTLPPPNSVVEGREVAVTVGLTFTNTTPISGAEIWLDVWIVYSNGTSQILHAELITTDTFGTRIVLVQLPSYSESFWMNNNDGPYLWAAATYNGTRETASQTASVSEVISQVSVVPWWVDLLLFLLPFIVISIIIIIIIWAYYAKRVKPRRLAQQQALEQSASQWAQRMMGLMNLRALFVTFSKTGLPIFTYDFSGGEMPSALLSGFLSAVNSFYTELSGEVDRESQLRDIHYKDLHLSLREGQYVVSVLILESSPSEVLTNSLAQFATEFESRFGNKLATFDGRIDVFDPATEIVEECFHGELLLAYECAKAPSRGFTRKIYDLAVKVANEEGRLYLPQLFVAAIEKFGANRKYDIANALEQLHEQGCLIPSNDNAFPKEGKSDNPGDSSPFF